MNQELKTAFYRNVMKLIEPYRKGRTLALIGDSLHFKAFLQQEYQLDSIMLVTLAKTKAVGGVTYIGDIRGQNDRYYLIAPVVKKTLDLQMKLFGFGYNDFDDCFFINHHRITIDAEVEDYSDEYGNHIHAPGCQVLLDGLAYGVQIDVGRNCRFADKSMIVAKNYGGAKITIGDNCSFERNVTLSVFDQGTVQIGSGTTFVHDTEMTVLGGMQLSIGSDCLFSYQVQIYCGDGHAIFDLEQNKRLNPQIPGSRKNVIDIGNHVWVGMRATILNRTVIGSSCVVGAGAIVKGDFPNNCMLAGVPAGIIRKNITWTASPQINDINDIPTEYRTLTADSAVALTEE